ncbi:MAG: hypothetical protein KGM42_16800 [Hyphomicrobiales bacterium]|nr:hypothetical protein [Hyphomicrobiales bacterium]
MDDPESKDQIAALEARIDALRDEIENCRKAILISRAAIIAGGLWLALTLIGFSASTAGFFLAVAAVLGGIVGAGSNLTSQRNARAELARCKSERDALIDALDLRASPKNVSLFRPS